jgi:hypothetical protein
VIESQAIAFLCDIADSDTEYAPAAQTAMLCVEEYGGDARLLALLIERAMDGWYTPRHHPEGAVAA